MKLRITSYGFASSNMWVITGSQNFLVNFIIMFASTYNQIQFELVYINRQSCLTIRVLRAFGFLEHVLTRSLCVFYATKLWQIYFLISAMWVLSLLTCILYAHACDLCTKRVRKKKMVVHILRRQSCLNIRVLRASCVFKRLTFVLTHSISVSYATKLGRIDFSSVRRRL